LIEHGLLPIVGVGLLKVKHVAHLEGLQGLLRNLTAILDSVLDVVVHEVSLRLESAHLRLVLHLLLLATSVVGVLIHVHLGSLHGVFLGASHSGAIDVTQAFCLTF